MTKPDLNFTPNPGSEPSVEERAATLANITLRWMRDRESAAETRIGRGIHVTVRDNEVRVRVGFMDTTAKTPTLLAEAATAMFHVVRDMDPDHTFRDTQEPLN